MAWQSGQRRALGRSEFCKIRLARDPMPPISRACSPLNAHCDPKNVYRCNVPFLYGRSPRHRGLAEDRVILSAFLRNMVVLVDFTIRERSRGLLSSGEQGQDRPSLHEKAASPCFDRENEHQHRRALSPEYPPLASVSTLFLILHLYTLSSAKRRDKPSPSTPW